MGEAVIIQHCSYIFNESDIPEYDNMIFASDGSVSTDGKGAFSWICSINERTFSHKTGTTGGNYLTMSSYRTEAMGVLSYLRYLNQQQIFTAATPPPCIIQCYCDNLGV